MRTLAAATLLLAIAGTSACQEPTDGVEETQAEELEAAAPTLSPQDERIDDTPRETPDEDVDAENYE